MVKPKLSHFRHIMKTWGSMEKTNSTRKNRKHQKKKKIQCGMDWHHKRSYKHESTRADQGCWGRDTVDISHSQISVIRQESEQAHQHITQENELILRRYTWHVQGWIVMICNILLNIQKTKWELWSKCRKMADEWGKEHFSSSLHSCFNFSISLKSTVGKM